MLVPCPSCNRHVRSTDACPFCGAQIENETTAASPLGRTSRAALFALATAACGSPSQVQPYGQPPLPPATEDASAPAATVPPQSSETAHVSAYGAAPQPTPQVTPKP